MVATNNKLQQIQRTLKKLRDDVEDGAELFVGANAFAVRTPLLKQANVNFVETFILFYLSNSLKGDDCFLKYLKRERDSTYYMVP